MRTSTASPQISIIIPAKNEAQALESLLPALMGEHPTAEIIVIDDGSSDATAAIVERAGATVLRHPYSKGNGAAIKTGARHAQGEILVCMDGDGQHRPEDVTRLVAALKEGYDMVVGARTRGSQASLARGFANGIYNRLASWVTGNRIPDLTSGLRASDTAKFREFLHLLPNGFSYPTTITMAFFRAGYSVKYEPILALKRTGKSHIRLFKDGTRFLLIIFKVGTLYSPLKLFVPISATFFLTGLCYYAYTFLTVGRFTNMSALLLSSAIIIFLIGLVSEQITTLFYSLRGR